MTEVRSDVKVGIASTDWSRSVKDEKGHPIWGGAGWVRMGQYVEPSRHEVVAGGLIWKDRCFGVMEWDGTHHTDCDILIMQRCMWADMPEKMRYSRANGQIIVNDIDDWYWGLDTSNAAWASTHPKANEDENRNHYAKVLANSTHVTVSTPYLAERLKRFVSCPITVIQNYVDVARFTPREHTDDTPIVGWVGSTAHRSHDLEELRGVLRPMVDGGLIRLHHSGHAESHHPFWQAVGVDPHQVTTSPLVAPQRYPESLCFDIGLAPLRRTPFNQAKSWIKAIEYAAAGIPFIASDLDEYRRLRDEYGIGLIAKRAKHWPGLIRSLLDPEKRAEIAVENRAKVWALDIAEGVKVWDEFLDSLT